MKLKLVSTPSESSGTDPVAFYVANGFKAMEEARWELLQKAGNPNDKYMLGKTENANLVGHTLSNATGQPTCRYAVGVIDKAAGTLRYCEVESGRVLRLEPRAHSLNYDVPEADRADYRADARDQHRRLVEAFGSTRRKRQLKTRDAGAVQADHVGGAETVKSMLQAAGEKAVAGGATKKEILEQAVGHRVLPPHHANATLAHEAYRLQDLIPSNVWNCLDDSTVATEIETLSDDASESFAKHCIEFTKNQSDVVSKRNRKGIVYLHALAKIGTEYRVQLNRGGIAGYAKSLGIQYEVAEAILEQFFSSERRREGASYFRSDQQKTLMLMHTLIIALILEGYRMGPRSCNMLRQELKLTPAHFTTLFKEMGCVVKLSAKKSLDAELGSPSKDMTVILMPPVDPPKKLLEYFPQLKIAGSKRGR